MEERVCHVVCAAPGCEHLGIVREPEDLIIAADGGYALCVKAGIEPDILIGDFDSLEGGRPVDFVGECIQLPCDKDDTDTMAALRIGIERGCTEFFLHNALGGDFGHSMANVHALAWLRTQGADGVVMGGDQAVCLLLPEDGEAGIEAPEGTRVSVFAFGGPASGICERGMRWNVEDVEMDAADSFGVSNEVAGPDACISVKEGSLLVVVG